MSLNDLQSVPSGNMILLVGPPGSGKSTFCHQAVLKAIEEKPTIYVTTESPPSKVAASLEELGLSKILPNTISYVDSYNTTIGLSESTPLVVEDASSENLTSLGIAITKLQRRIEKEYFLVFDSLTPPYLMNGSSTLSFLRKMLLKLASQGNSVLVSFDEGCGKSEDLVAMMSIANGIIKIELQDNLKTFDVIKHPLIGPSKISVSIDVDPQVQYNFNYKLRAHNSAKGMRLMRGPPVRKEVGDLVHIFWMNLSRWSGMLWDPKRFPTMEYNSNKCMAHMIKDVKKNLPWRVKLLLRLFIPKRFSSIKDMRKLSSFASRKLKGNRSSIGEYLENISKMNEHYFRWLEGDMCFGFDGVGATLALGTLGIWAGYMRGYEKDDRDWNWIETKCIGLGDPYCELKAVPGEIDELKSSLEGIDNKIIEKVFGILMERLTGYLFQGKPLWDRPKLGPYVSLLRFSDIMVLPAIESLRYREALRLGGVLAGMRVGEKMLNMGMEEDEAVKGIIRLLEDCKVGKVSIDKTIKIRECCESALVAAKEPACFFTTGFLNGFSSTVMNQHIKETKCVGRGDPYCEWEMR
jgi:predicted hydrocarbon binding protein/archaellum biogenesis ATPase FlaH